MTCDGCGNCRHWSADDDSMYEGTCLLTFKRMDQDELCKRHEPSDEQEAHHA